MLANLAWLPPPPENFRLVLKGLKAESAPPADGFGERLVRLALHSLDESQLARLAGVVKSLSDSVEPLTRLKLGLIGDGTLSLLGDAIVGSGLRHGLLIDVIESGYGNAVQEAADRNGSLHRAGLDMGLLALDFRLAGFNAAMASADAADRQVEHAFARAKMIVDAMRPGIKGPMLVQTLSGPVEPLFGSFDRVEAGSVFSMVDAFNHRLADWARDGSIVLVDVARLAASVGLEHWDDPRHWHASKLGFSPTMIPVYADVVARTIGAVHGKSKKALVLDLDNTLWGGVIGDDGLAGIVLGQGSATGEAFVAIQRMALDLRSRGIILAVCSKNEEDAARLPFRDHPDMLLKESHIAVFQANWTDKAANLRAIAATLNIGVDALVFLDDNPAERAQVRRELPMVGVPELPADPALYPRMLAAAGYFDTVTFSSEDRNRAELYQSRAEQAQLMAATTDMNSYLRSLDMVCTIAPVDALSRPRVVQLINKSNQFNLTTRRYTDAEIATGEADPNRHLAYVRLIDRFGDNGIISVLIADKQDDAWQIDTWLMSCRVLGRRIQEAALAHLVAAARAQGARRLVGRYLPTAKNRLVEAHYATLGFAPGGDLPGGGSQWVLDLAGYDEPELPMRLEYEARLPRDEVA